MKILKKMPVFLDLSKIYENDVLRIGRYSRMRENKHEADRIDVAFIPAGKFREHWINSVPKNALISAPASLSPPEGMYILLSGEGGKSPFMEAVKIEIASIIENLAESKTRAEIKAQAAETKARRLAMGEDVMLKDLAKKKRIIEGRKIYRNLPPRWSGKIEEEEEY
jgi:hypothetical protein